MDSKEIAKPQIQAVIAVLLESVADKNVTVAETVNASLRKIARKHPNDVLNSCVQFCKRFEKLNNEHLAEVLKSVEHICQEYIIEIDGDTIIRLIELAMEIMMQNNAYEPITQLPASGVLVALGSKHSIQVIEGLVSKLEPGTVPHYMIVYTLGSIASTNAFGVVPYTKKILENIIPLLGMIKLDYQKHAFAYALGRFSYAIDEYMLNINQAPDSTIAVTHFYTEMAMAYDMLSTNWLYSKEPKVTESVLEALSSVFSVLNTEKVNQQAPKFIPILLNFYKKHKEPLSVTHCLGSVIQVAALVNGTLLEPLLPSILHALSELVCITPDYAQPELLRNHSEVLRCYERLAMHFTDNCLDYLVNQLRHNNEKERVKALLILTHLANATEQAIHSRLGVFQQVLAELLNENSVRVKKAVLKMIVAFTYKGFLPPQNEHMYLLFIVKLCCKHAVPIKSTEVDQQEFLDLQMTADNTLYMLSTSVLELETVLWNLLLNCFLAAEYADAVITLLRCLTHLAARKQTKDTCEAAFIRCMALLAQPLPNFRGSFVLNFLKNIKLCQSDAYKSVWDTKILHLIKYLEQNYDNFNEKEWEDVLFDFLALVLEAVKNEQFNEALLAETKRQLPLYVTKPPENRLLLKCLAIVACQVMNEQSVEEVLNTIIGMANAHLNYDLYSCAEAIGICSRVHLKTVLKRFSAIRKGELSKSTNKLLHFNFMNNNKSEKIERIRFLILASYTEVCNEAPADALLQTVECEILDFAVNELENAKDFHIKHVCLKTVGAAADSLHPNRNSLHIQMKNRDKILKLVTSYLQLHSGPEYVEMYPIVMPVITSLVRLPPALDSEQRIDLLTHCFKNIYNASCIYCKINTDGSPGTYYGDLKMAPFVYTTFSKLNFVVQELIMQSLSPSTLDEIVTLLEPWLGRKKAEQRLPSLETLRDALQTYLDHVKFAYEGPTSFTQSGFLLARVVPRCTDPNKNIRKVGIETLRLILCITARYEGYTRDRDKLIGQTLEHIQEQIDSDKPKVLFNLTVDLAHAIITHIPPLQLPRFVNHLIDAVLDVEQSSSSGSSVVLNTVLKSKGNELNQYVTDLLTKMLGSLDKITCPRTRSSTLRAILSLAIHHPKVVVGTVLAHPLPYEQYINDCWSVFSTDLSLVNDILEQFKKIFKTHSLLQEDQNIDNLHIVAVQPLQVICAMSEIFKNTQLQEAVMHQFPELFSLLLITVASYIGSAAPATSQRDTNKKEKYSLIPNRNAYKLNPLNACLDTLKQLLLCGGQPHIAECLLIYNNIDNIAQFLMLVPVLTENVCINLPHIMAWLVASLAPYAKSDMENQRIAVAAFLTSFIKYRPTNQNVLTENVLEMLLLTQSDSCCTVRQVGLQGLGFTVEYVPWELTSRHSDSILNAFMQGLDYNNIGNESAVALEAMLSFSKLLKTANEHDLNSCQVTAAMRIKPLFEQEDSLLREAAFKLFGDLASSINHDKRSEAFKEQVCGALITLLLHLCDDSDNVVKACKYSLRKVAAFLESVEVNNMIRDHLLEEGTLHFSDFISDLIKIMAKELIELFPLFVMTCVSYFKSPWIEIRSYAALVTGMLYSHLDEESRAQISFDTVCYRLLQLLKDENPQVRTRAVQATAYMFIS